MTDVDGIHVMRIYARLSGSSELNMFKGFKWEFDLHFHSRLLDIDLWLTSL